MDKFWISILFLVLLYFVKILTDYKGFINDPDCFNLYEKLQASKATYFVAIPLSYIYCLVGAYDNLIEKLFCADLIYFVLIVIGVVIPVILISMQNKENNGTANSFSDMSGAIFFISTVTEAIIFLALYAIVFVVILLFYVIKCKKEDNYILHLHSTKLHHSTRGSKYDGLRCSCVKYRQPHSTEYSDYGKMRKTNGQNQNIDLAWFAVFCEH